MLNSKQFSSGECPFPAACLFANITSSVGLFLVTLPLLSCNAGWILLGGLAVAIISTGTGIASCNVNGAVTPGYEAEYQ